MLDPIILSFIRSIIQDDGEDYLWKRRVREINAARLNGFIAGLLGVGSLFLRRHADGATFYLLQFVVWTFPIAAVGFAAMAVDAWSRARVIDRILRNHQALQLLNEMRSRAIQRLCKTQS